jgi:hypothetical protein
MRPFGRAPISARIEVSADDSDGARPRLAGPTSLAWDNSHGDAQRPPPAFPGAPQGYVESHAIIDAGHEDEVGAAPVRVPLERHIAALRRRLYAAAITTSRRV